VPGVTVGFYGKVPARGDFVRAGLPRDFTDPWDDWLQSAMAGSRSLMGDDWLPAFLEAPVWRFRLPAGMCGTAPALGLMLPSVDRAGRYFPLTFAALSSHAVAPASGRAWLDACEEAGRAALERDTPPEDIASLLSAPELEDDANPPVDALWWSDGSSRVQPGHMTLSCLPDAATYAAMLGGPFGGADVTHDPAASGEGKWESTS
jgi:type VI secretion system protein ImpM